MKRWTRNAMRLTACRYLPESRMLDVSFANRDRLRVPVEALLGPSAAAADWHRLRIGTTRDVIEVRVDDRVTEIPWDRLRAAADAEFRRHLALKAGESARRIGRRLRELRRESGLTQAAVAKAAGLTKASVSRLESGQARPDLETLRKAVGAMGKTIYDLAADRRLVARSPR